MNRTWAGLALATWAGLAACNHLSGGDLIRDLLDLNRLRRLALERLDQRWAQARKSSLIACLTTLPSRLPHLHWTLKSLLAQDPVPARIRLHLPEHSRREQVDYRPPEWLTRLRSVELVRCPDLGPATKLLPALDLPERTPLLVVDDDRLYPPGFLAHLERFDSRATGLSGWRVPSDLTDRPTTLWSNLAGLPPTPLKCSRLRKPVRIDVLQGFSGYRVEPGYFGPEVYDYSHAPEAAFYVDDVWISAHCRSERWVEPFARFPIQHPILADLYRRTSLGRVNSGQGNNERRANTIMIRHFRGRWPAASPIERARDSSFRGTP
jgi:hypothetical protein